MLQRLSYIRIAPVAVLDAGCGAAHALEPLRARYPQLDYTGQDICSRLLDVARERYATRPGFWQKLRNKPTLPVRFRLSDLADSRSEEHTSELQSLMRISYAVFCLKKKITQ